MLSFSNLLFTIILVEISIPYLFKGYWKEKRKKKKNYNEGKPGFVLPTGLIYAKDLQNCKSFLWQVNFWQSSQDSFLHLRIKNQPVPISLSCIFFFFSTHIFSHGILIIPRSSYISVKNTYHWELQGNIHKQH